MKFSSILKKINSKSRKNVLKQAPFYFELTWSIFLIEIWITSNPIFSCVVSVGAKVSISSSYLFSKRDCVANVFFGDVIFALTAWTLSGNHLHTNWCKTLKIDVFIQNENKCTNRQKKAILSKLHQSRCSLTATAKFLMSTKVFLNSCHVLQNNIILGK